MSALDDWNAGKPLSAPIPTSLYPLLAYIFLSAGLFMGGMFVVQSKNTSLFKQLQTSLAASLFLGFGAVFTSISVGVYV
ncbi:predicted protein [Lichtheimia corymbifera JMRC:FSU:9682]|uniref:Dolichyl-diphosphooligosaccharide-protein glycosyltransferase subunit OST5 n=1 Tax=Lichtheimia corymbifera JMRC:FSU:9682 TaxID=1263082 RepID=A0A068S9S0_9FUNG|nr:predicted protein [Lichtheimia corymbifera JMRC:FSU:9682]